MIEKKRCAIYTRKSHEEGLDQDFNSLDSQRVYAESYIKSHEGMGWEIIETQYNDGGFSGGNLERPALKQLMLDIEAGLIDCVVVYKIDRLSRSLFDFAQLIECFKAHNVSFVSVTQSFNTADSMGRLMLNVLLSFAQYERELTGERIRDKFTAARKKGLWMGGRPPLGYDLVDKALIINETEKKLIHHIFQRFLVLNSITALVEELNQDSYRTKKYKNRNAKWAGGVCFSKTTLRKIITNPIYIGQVTHKGNQYEGVHQAIIDKTLWETVQNKFNNRILNQEKKTQAPMLLKGIIHCQVCNVAMTPTYTSKKIRNAEQAIKHYRYYICSNQTRGRNCQGVQAYVAAGEIEAFVVKQVQLILKSPEITSNATVLLEKTALDPRRIFELLKDIESVWQMLFPIEQQKIIQALVDKVLVSPQGVQVCVKTEGLKSLVHDHKEAVA